MNKMIILVMVCVCAGGVSAVPVPDIVFYGTAWLNGNPMSSGIITATVGGQTYYASFINDGGIDYYYLRIRGDNSIGGELPRPGVILIDDPNSLNRTLVLKIEGNPVNCCPIVLTEGGVRRLDISTPALPDCNGNGVMDDCERVRIFVNDDAGGINDGSDWDNAFNDLQDALAAAGAGTIAELWVAEGMYSPAGPGGSRSATFQLRQCVDVYGGFAGNESDRSERCVGLHRTVLSGDLNGDDEGGAKGENSYHVVTGTGADSSAVLDGFIIAGGYANGSSGNDRGAGMYNVTSGGPTVRNCTFVGNYATHGGAMYNRDTHPMLINCLFIANRAGMQGGGGIFNWRSNATLINCVFSGNVATGHNGGGGMRVVDTTNMTLVNCTFSSNSSVDSPYAGGIFCYSSSLTLSNCILWANTRGGATDEAAQISFAPTAPAVSYSCIQGLSQYAGNHNIGDDPLFADADGADDIAGTEDDDLSVFGGSYCIDSGDNDAVPSEILLDVRGLSRFVDNPLSDDTGHGSAPVVDMGAHEFAYPGDINRDGAVDGEDFGLVAVNWLDGDSRVCCGPDLDNDGDVDLRDLSEFAMYWLAGRD